MPAGADEQAAKEHGAFSNPVIREQHAGERTTAPPNNAIEHLAEASRQRVLGRPSYAPAPNSDAARLAVLF